MREALLSVRGLMVEARAGRGPRLLGPVDLDVERGEHLLLIGPSGAGKTTLLRALAGLARPSAGVVRLGGRVVSEGAKLLIPPRERRVGFLFQGGALWPHMSVAGTLTFVYWARGVARAERKRKASELLAQVGLAELARRKVSTLSGGEAQRLALARALASEAELLLLDEPLGPIDGLRRRELLALLARLQAERTLTILHVTHDPEEARAVATRTLKIEAGRFVEPVATATEVAS